MAEKRNDREGAFEKVGEAMGGMAGKAAGRGMDMAMDIGTSLVSTAATMLGGWWAGPEASRAAGSFGDREDRVCRTHFERSRGGSAGAGVGASTGGSSATDYDSARPAYQFGHVAGQNPDYQGRSFDEVEAELQRAWAEAGSERYGDWPEMRGFVGFGYDQRGSASA